MAVPGKRQLLHENYDRSAYIKATRLMKFVEKMERTSITGPSGCTILRKGFQLLSLPRTQLTQFHFPMRKLTYVLFSPQNYDQTYPKSGSMLSLDTTRYHTSASQPLQLSRRELETSINTFHEDRCIWISLINIASVQNASEQ